MKLHLVDNMDQVLAIALEGPLPQIRPRPTQRPWLPSQRRLPEKYRLLVSRMARHAVEQTNRPLGL